jgi:hypothetical protein
MDLSVRHIVGPAFKRPYTQLLQLIAQAGLFKDLNANTHARMMSQVYMFSASQTHIHTLQCSSLGIGQNPFRITLFSFEASLQ